MAQALVTTALQTAQDSNDTGTAVALSGAKQGDKIGIYVSGTFDTCTVTLQVSVDNVVWMDLDTFTAAEYVVHDVLANYVRANVSSVGGSTEVTCLMIGAEVGTTETAS